MDNEHAFLVCEAIEEPPGPGGIELDGEHSAGASGQSGRENAGAGAQLQNEVASGDVGFSDEPVGEGAATKEVLRERPPTSVALGSRAPLGHG